MNTNKLAAAASLLLLSTLARAEAPATAPAELPTKIEMDNPAIHYIGRFDLHDPKTPACSWPGTGIETKFTGTAVNLMWRAGDKDRLQVVIDGKAKTVLVGHKGQELYNVATGLSAGEHTLQLVKRVEATCGISRFGGLQLDAGATVSPVASRPHNIEVIGDSISCGYGNEGASKAEHFSPDTENAYMTYWAIAARQLDADASCIAWSGKLMYPKNTIGELYDRTLPTNANSQWDFSKSAPDVVVITLGTNDWNRKGMTDTAAWVKGYGEFIDRVRTHYPKAVLYLAKSPMLNGKGYETVAKCLDEVIANRAAAGDTQVHLLDFKTQDAKDGIGSDWHPSVKTHEKMAKVMTDAIAKDLGWTVKE